MFANLANVYVPAREQIPVIMVKRACPFNDDLNPQLKIHVRQKEVATGVMSDHHMRNVYDRTKDLLFKGARKSATLSALETNQSRSNSRSISLPGYNSVSSLKQMQLTSEGQLSCPKGAHVQIFSASNHLAVCSKCFVCIAMEMNACSFCDLMLCSTCLQTCRKCKEHFCSACSFNVYDASDGYICRKCY